MATLVAPLQWLWLWTLPFWPVVPDRLPLLLVFAGPFRWVIAVAACVTTFVRVARAMRWRVKLPHADRRAVFVVSLLVYLAAGFGWNHAVGVGGDEPHYLVIAHSLLVDHDLNIENNHAQRDYVAFYPGTLRPDYLTRGKHAEIYSVHAPGLPALLLPAYAIAGARGAVAFQALVSALTAVAIFDVAVMLGSLASGWLTWAAVCLSVPFVPHAWLIYPEMPAALIVAWGARWIVSSAMSAPGQPIFDDRAADGVGPVPAPARANAWHWVLRGTAIGVLPWLHTKYAVLLAFLTVFVALTIVRRRGRAAIQPLAWFILPITASLIAWFASFYVMYGVFDPQAPYGAYSAAFIKSINIPRGVLGLLIDQKFGLVVYAPVYVLAAIGAWSMFRRRGPRLVVLAAFVTITVFVVFTARFYMWWGGTSAPARFLVPIVPLLALLMAGAFLQMTRARAFLLGASIVVAGAAMIAPGRMLLLSAPHGEAELLTSLQGSAPLAFVWPTFTEPTYLDQFGRAARALVGRFDQRVRARTVDLGRARLLDGYDSRLRAFDYPLRRRADEAFVVSRGAQRRTRTDGELNEDPARLAGPFDLAAGTYQIRVWFTGEPAPASVRYHRGPVLVTFAAARDGQPTEGELRLRVDAPLVWIAVGDELTARRVDAVDVVPTAVVSRSARVDVEPIAIEPLAGDGLLIYADRDSYPEGGVFWTRDTARARFYVQPGRASRLTATVHAGPRAATIRVSVGGEARELKLQAGETTAVSWPIEAAASLIPLSVESSGSFIPARTDPHSDDTRQLGCQVRITLS